MWKPWYDKKKQISGGCISAGKELVNEKTFAFTMIVFIMTSLLAGCGDKNQVQSSIELTSKEDSQALVAEEERNEISSEESDLETDSAAELPVVFFTKDITAEGLVRIYEQLDWQPTGNVAVKISTGEPPASNYLRPELIGDLVQQLDGTIVECSTTYSEFLWENQHLYAILKANKEVVI